MNEVKMRFTKKRVVLLTLFIAPLLFFIFLSTGTNNYNKLPVLNPILDIKNTEVKNLLEDKVSVLVFIGDNPDAVKASFFNLNEKIYKKFYGYKFFNIVAIHPKDNFPAKLKKDLGMYTDMQKWKFVGMENEEIKELFASLKTTEVLSNNYSNMAFIIDKELNLRGRNDDDDVDDGIMTGYNMTSVAVLKNKMQDDIKVLLYEYRAAFKNKNKAERKTR